VRARPAPLALISLGGALGAAVRYEFTLAFPVHAGHFPFTTFAINISGAFLLGLLLEWLARHRDETDWARWFVGVGVLGAFTTFSTMAVELTLLARDGHALTAVAYATASLAVGLAAVILGLVAAGWRRAPVPAEGES
jgi:fluoride exporter